MPAYRLQFFLVACVFPRLFQMLRFPYLPCEHQGNSHDCTCCCLCMLLSSYRLCSQAGSIFKSLPSQQRPLELVAAPFLFKSLQPLLSLNRKRTFKTSRRARQKGVGSRVKDTLSARMLGNLNFIPRMHDCEVHPCGLHTHTHTYTEYTFL